MNKFIGLVVLATTVSADATACKNDIAKATLSIASSANYIRKAVSDCSKDSVKCANDISLVVAGLGTATA